MPYLCPARTGSGMARISKGGLGKRPHQREDDPGSGAALLPAPLGRGRTRDHRRGLQPDQRCWMGAWGSGALHGRPRADPAVLRVCPGCWAQVSHWLLLPGHGWEDSSLQMRLAGPGLPSRLPRRGSQGEDPLLPAGLGRREHQGSGLRWGLVPPAPPPSLPGPLPALTHPGRGRSE